ncbi:keratin, type I cytoskeletal 9-like [Cotesia glomerata]|uniref:Uncharacterized protein n=1 Tax=Cotesia glomerata TaxID=32391 RepID=A0AAV7I1Q6_COTGL|nr:keratin, type I cytoskeletal 9-like [Cotesia glomerata]KAH0540460.1 hypothetical protein KQX54_017522 [Cotesia glomerata]
MLRILLIVSSYLMTSHCLTVSAGYTVGTRSRDYNPGSYSTSGGFVGLSSSGSSQRSSSSPSSSSQGSSSLSSLSKDTHADLTDQLTSSGSYGGAGSHRYSTSTGGHSTSGSDDNTQGLATGYSSSNTDNINSISSPYTNTNTNTNSNDIYTSTDVNPYSGSSDSSYGSTGHGSQSLSNYASHSIGADHNSIDYNSYGASSSSSSAGGFGPKVSAFNPKSHPHGHNGYYGIGSGMKFLSNPHPNYPASNHLNSYPGHIGAYSGGRHGGPGLPSPAALTNHGSHGGPGLNYPGSHGFNDGPRYSGSSVNYLSNHGSGPGNFIHGGGPSSPVHRNIPSFLLGAASSVNPTFVKSPSSFFSGSFGPKVGNKFVIIKDAGGAGPSHLMHPETGGGFSGGMFAGAGGYKVRSAGPYSAGSTNHFNSGNYPSHAGHTSSLGYSGSVGHHHAPAAASSATGSYFGY